jgi:glycosyltransferase involved in cell wall biosynthesis
MERQLRLILKHAPAGMSPIVFVVGGTVGEQEGAEFVSLPPALSTVFTIRSSCRANRLTTLHSLSFGLNAIAWVATLGLRTISIGSVRGDWRAEQARAGLLRGLVCRYLPARQTLNSKAALAEAGLVRGPWSVARGFHANCVERPAASTRLREPSTKLTVLGIGSLTHAKNWARAISIFARVANHVDDVKLVIAGEGPLKEELSAQISALDLRPGQVTLLGRVSPIEPLLATAAIVLHTATDEGTPNALIEAQNFGIPVVAFDAGDIGDVVLNDISGYIVSSESDGVDALVRLLRNEDIRTTMGAAGRRHVEQAFGSDAWGSLLLAYKGIGLVCY